ncbi:hypothetical protein [Archangium lansingense]|uniref:DNA methylase adenine-specific domain-containing protein n=1 Tax=Archangium lansingense TaxID=2995310 RepID=A0ABT3ZXX0_9BACT|nr:hypothetical protein [Archangium lansinium]MCY1073552.1 hypothetical protein [Archangium lansinium]
MGDQDNIGENLRAYVQGFSPAAREVIRLMVNLLFIEDNDALSRPGVVRSLYDPTAGTGGMLSVASSVKDAVELLDDCLELFGSGL